MTHFKATRPDGTDFATGRINYAAALAAGDVVQHPVRMLVRERKHGLANCYLSVSVSAADCTGMSWPCRLFEVQPVGRPWTPDVYGLPSKRACHSLRVVRELPAHEALGPNGVHVAALIERARTLTRDEVNTLAAARDAARYAARDAVRYAVRDAAWDAAWDAVRDAAWDAVRYAAGDAAWDAAGYAAVALVVRDLIGDQFTQNHYDLLTGPWRKAFGHIHPDDADMS